MTKDSPKLCKDCRHSAFAGPCIPICEREGALYVDQHLERCRPFSDIGGCGPSAKHFEAR